VVSAYLQAVLKADELKSGEIFNVASGVPRRMGDILGEMILLSGVDPVLETDPSLVRPDDIPRFVGDAEKARRELNWRPEHDLSETLAGILSEWRSREAHFD
jgi:GDP-4-dehydro-6-deoxy-D-mannose reductase